MSVIKRLLDQDLYPSTNSGKENLMAKKATKEGTQKRLEILYREIANLERELAALEKSE